MKNIVIVILILGFSQVYSANRYWIGSGNWNTTANWSTSSGGASGASVPGASDVAIFDALNTGNCTIDANVSISGLDIQSGFSDTLFQNAGFTITIGSGDFALASGAFVGGNSVIDINSGGTFTLSGGSFTSTSSNLSIGGSTNASYTIFNYSGGAFNHNNGKVIIDPDLGGCGTRIVTMTITAPSWPQFNDFEIKVNNTSCTEDRLLITTGDTIIVLGDFTHSDGLIYGVIQCEGNLITVAGADGGTGVLYLTNTANITYSNTSTSRMPQVIVNKSSGTVTAALGTTDIYFQSLEILSGSFTAPTGTIYIGGNWNTSITLLNHSGGTFAHNNGAVRIDPNFSGCGTRTATISSTAIPKIEFYDLFIDVDNVSCTEDRLEIPLGDTIVVRNDFTHQDGFVNTGVVRVLGDIFLESGADGGSATIFINDVAANQQYHNTTTSRFAHIKVDKAGGTFTPGVGTTNFYCQQLSLINGSFTAPTGTFYIGGTWNTSITLLTHSGGTFIHNSGEVRLDPDFSGCGTRTATITSTATPKIQFYDLFVDVDNISCTEDRLDIPLGDTIEVANNFTHQDGFVNTGVIRVLGDIFLENGADGGSATIFINHASANQEYHNTTTSRFAHIKVDKAGGTFTPGVGTTNFYCQQLSLINGSFTAPTGTFYIGGTWNTSITLLTHSGGTFIHNSGEVRLDPDFSGCGTRTATITSTATPKIQFYDLFVDVDNISCTEDRLDIPLGDTIEVANNFTHQDGFVNTGVIRVLGDIFLENGADGGSATIFINHASANQEYHNTTTSRFAHIKVDKAGGTFTPGVGTTNFYCQQLSIINGSFTAPTGTLYIGGTWNTSITLLTHSGGTFTHNNGEVRLDPDFSGCGTRTATISSTASPKIQFYDLFVDVDNISCTEDRLEIPLGDTIVVLNDFTHQDGFVNTGVVRVLGDIFLESGADGGSATIFINHASANQQYYNTTTSRFAHIKVDKAGGTFTPGVGTTNFYCQQLSIVNGSVTAPSGTFYIGGTWNTSITLLNHTGGTFIHNNGEVRLDPDFSGCGVRTATISSTATPKIAFFDFYVDVDNISCTEDRLNIPLGDTIVVLNDFTHKDGMINTGVLQVERHIYMLAGADGGTATIYLTNTNNQEYSNISTSRFPHLFVDKSSGTVSPATGTTSIYMQRFTLQAGTWTCPAGGMYVGGTWGSNVTLFLHSGGTFTHNNSTVYIDPDFSGCGVRTATIDVISATRFYSLYLDINNISCSEDRLTISAGDTLKVDNNLTLFDGQANTGKMSVLGNVVVNSGFDGGNAELIFNGGNAQNFDLTGATNRFDADIRIDKITNNVTLLSDCQMDGGTGRDLYLMKGDLLTATSTLLIIGDNVQTFNASDTSFVDGPLRKIGNESFDFPLGDLDSIYAPISITAPTNTNDQFTGEYRWFNPDSANYDTLSKVASLDHISIMEYWTLDRTNGTSNVSVTLSWGTPRSGGVDNLSELTVARWDTALSQWQDHGNGGTTGNTTSGTVITSAAVTSFSPFSLASTTSNNPLPIELLSFDAELSGDLVILNWITLSEINNDYFTIEKTLDLKEFTEVKIIEGAGNSSSQLEYIEYDTEPYLGVSYYRLKQTDYNGAFSYSSFVAIDNREGSQSDLEIFPNPWNQSQPLIVNFPTSIEGSVLVQLFDILGKPVYEKLYHLKDSTKLMYLDSDLNIKPGTYVLKIDSETLKYNRLIVIQ